MSDERPWTFALQRHEDVTGVSGTGHVADGVRWPDGSTSIRWRGERPSVVFWDSHDSVEAIHGHNGATRIVWDNRAVTPPDLDAVQARLQTVLQGEIECWDHGPLMEAVWASLQDVQPLLAEIARLRPGVEWQARSVGFLADGDIFGEELHRWRIKLGERTEACAHRLLTERRPAFPSIAGAPNGLPLFVRRTDEPCDCHVHDWMAPGVEWTPETPPCSCGAVAPEPPF